jgi:hypothetical protein
MAGHLYYAGYCCYAELTRCGFFLLRGLFLRRAPPLPCPRFADCMVTFAPRVIVTEALIYQGFHPVPAPGIQG